MSRSLRPIYQLVRKCIWYLQCCAVRCRRKPLHKMVPGGRIFVRFFFPGFLVFLVFFAGSRNSQHVHASAKIPNARWSAASRLFGHHRASFISGSFVSSSICSIWDFSSSSFFFYSRNHLSRSCICICELSDTYLAVCRSCAGKKDLKI